MNFQLQYMKPHINCLLHPLDHTAMRFVRISLVIAYTDKQKHWFGTFRHVLRNSVGVMCIYLRNVRL